MASTPEAWQAGRGAARAAIRYGREMCAVFVGFRDVGMEQIRAGMAWWYREYAHEQTAQDRLVYRDEEESAQANRVGLWKDAKPVPPWEWRRRDREEKTQ